ncbi:MAG: alkaline phosphatase, partial [Bacteroidales bacterium]|nr:alkaline phosphatase [Bacteroidales bacterium]
MKKYLLSICISILTAVAIQAQTAPKNIIIFVANGMGFNHVKASELYTGTPFEAADYDFKSGSTNYPAYWHTLSEAKDVNYYRGDYHIRRIWSEMDYAANMATNPVTAATSIATGVKSAYNAAGVDLDSSVLETIFDRALAQGKKIGAVTDISLEISGINSFINKYIDITNETNVVGDCLGNTDLSVLIASQQSVSFETIPAHWNVILQTSNDFADFVSNNSEEKVLGLHHIDGMTQEGQPSLAMLAKTGLHVLQTSEGGFVLVVETDMIDKYSTENNTQMMLQAMTDVRAAIAATLEWVENNSSWDETLMMIVGSYESGYITSTEFDPAGKDYMTTVPVSEGAQGELPDMKFNTSSATNLLTPFYAHGAGAEKFQAYTDEFDIVYGPYINNTEIAQVCFELMPKTAPQTPKNIILMISDGGGINQIMAANYYTGTTQAYQNFPVQTYVSTYPLLSAETFSFTNPGAWNNSYESRLAWTDLRYVLGRTNATCSGAAATAFSTGQKSYYYGLGVSPQKDALTTIARHAKSIGKSAGVASNGVFSSATPAAFFANNVDRESGTEITLQLIIESQADVIVATGHPEYDDEAQKVAKPSYTKFGGEQAWNDFTGGKTEISTPSLSGWNTVQDIDNDGTPDAWTFVDDSAQFAGLSNGENLPKRLFGLATVKSSLQIGRSGNNQEVHLETFNKHVPTLAQMSLATLNVLNQNANGFFAMIENDDIDNAGHSNFKGRSIEEQIMFNEAVDSVIAWIEKHGGWDENLLIVTSDHETGMLAGPGLLTDSTLYKHTFVQDKGVGNMPGMEFYGAKDHSNQLVPLFAKGVAAEAFLSYADERDFVRGTFMNNSEIAQCLYSLWEGEPRQIINHRPILLNKPSDVTI